MLIINETISIPDAEITWTFARSGGPGGQNVNKVSSKALLRWAMHENTTVPAEVKARLVARHPSRATTEGEFLVSSSETRNQDRNRERCQEKLIAWLQEALHVPKPRVKTKPSRGSNLRRLQDKKKQSQTKARRNSRNFED